MRQPAAAPRRPTRAARSSTSRPAAPAGRTSASRAQRLARRRDARRWRPARASLPGRADGHRRRRRRRRGTSRPRRPRAACSTTRRPRAVYVPAGAAWRVTAHDDAELAVCTAPADAAPAPPRLHRAGDDDARGARHAAPTRATSATSCRETEPAERLLVVEVITPARPLVELSAAQARHRRAAGRDRARGDLLPPRSTRRRASPSSASTPTTAAWTRRFAVEDGDVVMVPRGYHPVVRAARLRPLLPERHGRPAAASGSSATTRATSGCCSAEMDRDAQQPPHLGSVDRAALDARATLAKSLVREAGAIAMQHYRPGRRLVAESKGLQDIVTVADRAVEDFVVARIAEGFPGDVVLGEEHGFSRAYDGAAPLWVIDPIDGTANFARGLPLWCVSLGLLVGGEPVAGAIFNPATGELHAGSIHEAATLDGRAIRVSPVTDPRESRVSLGFSFRRDPSIHVGQHHAAAGRRLRVQPPRQRRARPRLCRRRTLRGLLRAAHQRVGRGRRHRHRASGGRLDQRLLRGRGLARRQCHPRRGAGPARVPRADVAGSMIEQMRCIP